MLLTMEYFDSKLLTSFVVFCKFKFLTLLIDVACDWCLTADVVVVVAFTLLVAILKLLCRVLVDVTYLTLLLLLLLLLYIKNVFLVADIPFDVCCLLCKQIEPE